MLVRNLVLYAVLLGVLYVAFTVARPYLVTLTGGDAPATLAMCLTGCLGLFGLAASVK